MLDDAAPDELGGWVLVVTATTGDGDMPYNADRFWRALSAETAPRPSNVLHSAPLFDRSSYVRGIVRTFEFEGMPGHVSLETLTLEEHGGSTVVRTNAVFQSVEDRDGMVQSGMEEGVNDSMERLEALVTRLAPAG